MNKLNKTTLSFAVLLPSLMKCPLLLFFFPWVAFFCWCWNMHSKKIECEHWKTHQWQYHKSKFFNLTNQTFLTLIMDKFVWNTWFMDYKTRYWSFILNQTVMWILIKYFTNAHFIISTLNSNNSKLLYGHTNQHM